MQDLAELRKQMVGNSHQNTRDLVQLAIAERLDGILTEMRNTNNKAAALAMSNEDIQRALHKKDTEMRER